MKIFALYDKATAVYGPPMFFTTTGVAMRAIGDEVNRAAPDNNLHNHASDFTLFYIGEYEDGTAAFTNTRIEKVMELSELKQ